MLLSRSMHSEIMDDVTIHDERLDDALRELTIINKWLGGNSVTRKGISDVIHHIPSKNGISILDVGAGGSDLYNTISSIHPSVKITSLDLNFRACKYSHDAFPLIQVVNGSVLNLPFKDRSFDIVHASLFLHHFTEKELNEIIKSLFRISRHGIVINDLRRSILSYIGISVLTQLFSHSEMVKHDAPLSVQRGFSYKEMENLCSLVPSEFSSIKRMWAFRWCVCIFKKNE